MNNTLELNMLEVNIMSKFNNGKPYHGSDIVERGRLMGATVGSDYFYFFCPKCPDKYIMRILDHGCTTPKKKIPIVRS